MDTPSLLNIFDLCYTKSDAVTFVNKLSTLSDFMYNTKVDIAQKADEILSLEEKRLLTQVFQEQHVVATDPKSFNPFLEKVKEALQKVPRLTLTLAFDPTPAFLHETSNWLQVKMEKKYFLDIQVDTSLIGGAVVAVDGMIKDYSLKKYLEEKYLKEDLVRLFH